MESRWPDLSEAWSVESNPNSRPPDDESASVTSRRSYECIFCKRGFTNAQALGGHMNIHRSDRARGKQVIAGPSNLSGTKPPKLHYPVRESHRGYYCGTSHVPTWDVIRHYSDESVGNCFDYHNVLRPSLELSHVENNYEMQSTQEQGKKIDLELRLGHCGR